MCPHGGGRISKFISRCYALCTLSLPPLRNSSPTPSEEHQARDHDDQPWNDICQERNHLCDGLLKVCAKGLKRIRHRRTRVAVGFEWYVPVYCDQFGVDAAA